MGTDREERLASNEAMFRFANERMAGWEERHEDAGRELYFCECVDPDCREKVALTLEEYESVRASSRTFFVLPGHEKPDVESVVDQHEGWLVVRKPESVAGTVDPSDPRAAGP
ncbi:MAG: hypothetical protein QOE65_2914 [Solirubrobacteraceae bacterium]|jgi:hypothetical protein|nr:hypothetical protein [Solirubrobacteraceae bacterium]